MSLLGLGAMQGAQLEEKMAANLRYGIATFYAAEAGLQQAINNHTLNQILPSFSGQLGQNAFDTTVTNSTGSYTVVSTASHAASGAQRKLSMVIQGVPGSPPTIAQWVDHE
jgi:Tfp pilus assembly protein PilX